MQVGYRGFWHKLGGVLLVFAAASAWGQGARVDMPVGVRSAHVEVPERGHEVALTHWYPAGAGGKPEPLGASAVFLGTAVHRDAPVEKGRFPVVVLAHGGLRANRYAGAWLAASLVRQGFWVVQVHHPVLKASDASLAMREAWLRPADLSAAVSAVEQDPWVARHTHPTGGVGLVGVLRGGTSAVMLAGGRLDPSRYARLCDGPGPSGGPDCAWFRHQQVDWAQQSSDAKGRSRLDVRVRVAVVVAPELGLAFEEHSLAQVAVPLHFISLGSPQEVPPFLDASRLAASIPNATHQALAKATVFSTFGPCTNQGPSLLKEEGEDPALCAEAVGQTRATVQAELASLIAKALRPLQVLAPK